MSGGLPYSSVVLLIAYSNYVWAWFTHMVHAYYNIILAIFMAMQ